MISRLRWNAARGKYASEEIARDKLETNASGRGNYLFRPGGEGFYRIEWSGRASGGAPLPDAETHVWSGVAVGWQARGVEVITNPAGTGPGGGTTVLVGGAAGSDVVCCSSNRPGSCCARKYCTSPLARNSWTSRPCRPAGRMPS